MVSVVPIFNPEDYKQVRQRILKLYREGLTIINESYAWPKMRERKIEVTDVQYVITTGRVVAHTKPGRYWRFVLEGTSLDNSKPLRCVVEINGYLMVVTVMIRKGSKWT